MSTHFEDKEIELSEDYSSKRSSLDQEQEQSLLRDWKENSHSELGESDVRQRKPKSCLVWVLIAATIALASLITVGSVLGVRRATGVQAVAASEGVQTNDYVLDPQWDFEASPQRREYTWFVCPTSHSLQARYLFKPFYSLPVQFLLLLHGTC